MRIDTRNKTISQIIRINHAGEFAAKRIYEGQLRFTRDPKEREKIRAMAEGEEKHLKYFEDQIKKRNVRPTFLYLAVDKISYGVGAISAALGKDMAMLCTSAVEEVISDHYEGQLKLLDSDDQDLKDKIKEFRDDELEHKQIADEYDIAKSPAHRVFGRVIKNGCKLAIKLVRYL